MRARRRTAAQQLGLEQVQREIKATDPHGRLKYLREFSEAFREYQWVLSGAELQHYQSVGRPAVFRPRRLRGAASPPQSSTSWWACP